MYMSAAPDQLSLCEKADGQTANKHRLIHVHQILNTIIVVPHFLFVILSLFSCTLLVIQNQE